MKLTKEEKEIIRKIGHPYYTERHIQAWLDVDLQKTNQMKDFMRFTAASAYLDAVRGMLREQERRNHAKDNDAQGELHACRSADDYHQKKAGDGPE